MTIIEEDISKSLYRM